MKRRENKRKGGGRRRRRGRERDLTQSRIVFDLKVQLEQEGKAVDTSQQLKS
jgi:hypothetical protein